MTGLAARRIRLGKTIKLLRESKRLSVDAAAAAAPMSATTWVRVEDGKTVRGLTYRGIEGVLGLRPGIIDGVLEGRIPWTDLEGPRPQAPPQSDPTVEHLRRTPGVTPEFREALEALAREMRRNAS